MKARGSAPPARMPSVRAVPLAPSSGSGRPPADRSKSSASSAASTVEAAFAIWCRRRHGRAGAVLYKAALGEADGPDVQAAAGVHAAGGSSDDLGGAAAHVQHRDGRELRKGARGAPKRQLGLGFARDHAVVEAQLVADAARELRRVGRVARGAGGADDDGFGAERVGFLAVGAERRHRPLHRRIREAPRAVDAFAQPSKAVLLVDRRQRPVRRHVGHEQENGVAADVDSGDACFRVWGRARHAGRATSAIHSFSTASSVIR